jgi:hypothetical protein
MCRHGVMERICNMEVDISQWPLLVLMEHLREWIRFAKKGDFWRYGVEQCMELESMRDEAKGIIIWLELKGQEDAASQLDDIMSELRCAMWHLQEQSDHVYPHGDPGCEDALESLIDAASRASGAAEDLQDEVPDAVWEGFFDV